MRNSLLLIFVFVHAQVLSQGDSDTLRLTDYYDQISAYHPIAKQAILFLERGALSEAQARGAFDPKLVSSFDQKRFDGKDYFDIWDAYVELPTALNFDVQAGYERNSGLFLNPERVVPDDGLFYAGISVPIGQGLINSERNMARARARLDRQQLEFESRIVLNNLFADATIAYWNWYAAYHTNTIVAEGLNVVRTQFDGIRQSVINGENAAIDSVESLIQVQYWTNRQQEALLALRQAELQLNNFWWAPYEHGSIPSEDFTIASGEETVHPFILSMEMKQAMLEVDRKFAAEQIKPELNISYAVLFGNQTNTEFLQNDYKLGLDFAFPLLIRKERAKLKMAKVKIEQTEWKLKFKRREIQNKIIASEEKLRRLELQVSQQEEIVRNLERMVEAERTKFVNGESSIFLVNNRVNKRIESHIKLISLHSKRQMAQGELRWARGDFYQMYDD